MNKVMHFLLGILLIVLHPSICFTQEMSFKDLNFSIWSEYSRMNFEGLSQDEKTKRLTELFSDQLKFVEKHGTRRLIIKILDPSSFSFFRPEHFSEERDDNFLYWAIRLSNYAQIEALFDISPFQFTSQSILDYLQTLFISFKEYFDPSEKPFGNFENLIEKLEWVARVNESSSLPIIKGITLDPQGAGQTNPIYQNLINALDQFRFSSEPDSQVPEWVPKNSYYPLSTAILLNFDQKNLALANLGDFNLEAEIRFRIPGNLGIQLPPNFPSNGENPPNWRAPNERRSMLDTVYLSLDDPRFIKSIYQNEEVLPDPTQHNREAAKLLSNYLGCNFRGEPFVKGVGTISCKKGTSIVKGDCTYFRTGNLNGEGQFLDGQIIQVRPPYAPKEVSKVINGVPYSNRKMRLVSSFSTTFDIQNAEYYLTPISMFWNSPLTRENLRQKLYFVFSSDFNPSGNQYFGNWCYENFMDFFSPDFGFLSQKFFTDLSEIPRCPHRNLVIKDFTTIPNGTPYPECNWNLGNETH